MTISVPEIIYIIVISAGSIIYALYMKRAGGSQNAMTPPPPPPFNRRQKLREKKREEKKLKQVEEAQGGLEEKFDELTNKFHDLKVAFDLKPEEEKKQDASLKGTQQES